MLTKYLIASLSLPVLALSAAVEQRAAFADVQFTITFPEYIVPGSTIDLSWEGGDGFYNVYRILNYPDLPDTRPGFILRNTTDTSVTYTVDGASYFPDNSTLLFGVSDANSNVDVDHGYQLVGPLPVHEE
ncbi:hypothetical protein IAR50_006671 [Cryptococcus sp. DSM 104548]